MSTLHAGIYSQNSATDNMNSAPVYINPAQMQPTQAGPSSISGTTNTRKKIAPNPKRRRSIEDSDDSGPDSSSRRSGGTQRKRDGPKKKKANRACLHCQKAHLTCDDSRPCQRCIKRGIADSCTEGHRKKAKYLLDDEELEQLKTTGSGSVPPSAPPTIVETTAPPTQPVQQTLPPLPPPTLPSAEPFAEDPYFGAPFDSTFAFGSEAANLEYSILSAILGNPSPPESNLPDASPPEPTLQWPSATENVGMRQGFDGSPPLLGEQNDFMTGYPSTQAPAPIRQSSDSSLTLAPSSNYVPPFPYQSTAMQAGDLQSPYLQLTSPQAQPQPLHPLQPRYPGASPEVYTRAQVTNSSHNGTTSAPASPTTASSALPVVAGKPIPSQLQTILERVNHKYDYTEGYHFLMKYLQGRFEKNDILRVVRALAIFRPSLIALQMPLSLDDEIFLEKCFQRSLLELEKLISFSGTPTAVWRRTGEICLVAPEFCAMTDWPMEELVGKKKFMYELFENQSVVEYWESFASHAFENTTQSVYSHCVLLKPSGAPVPATFCFTIRKDLFDIPSVVIGQWLPLL